MNTYLSTGTDEQRTDIKRGTTLVGGDPLLVQTNHFLDHLTEQLCAHLGHHNAAASALQAGCVLFHTEHAHLTVWAAIGLQSLESLLTVVQTGGCHVQVQILIGANFDFTPFSLAIVTTYVVVGLHVAE